MLAVASHPVEGHVSRGFEAVREAFAENFARRGELGGACCAYHHGEKVVDLWGGIRNKQTGEPWEGDTMVVVHSATKGLAAMTLALAHSRGWLDYEERVATYWPEFAQQGKEKITVRQLLAHQAGLFAFDEPVDRSVVADLDRLAVVLARQKPAWEPGTRQAYHALTLGFYEGELLRRVDPQHRSLGQFFQDEIASPLGDDVYIRVPEEIPNARLATLSSPSRIRMLTGFPLRFALEAMNPHSNIFRALVINPGSAVYLDEHRVYARDFEVPSGGAVGTARGIAHAYGAFAASGHELGLRQETLDLLAAPAIPPTHGFYDECLKGEVLFSLGFMKPSRAWPFGGPAPSAHQDRAVRLALPIRRAGGVRVRDQPDGDELDRRPARRGAERGALCCTSRPVKLAACQKTMVAIEPTCKAAAEGGQSSTQSRKRTLHSECQSAAPTQEAPASRDLDVLGINLAASAGGTWREILRNPGEIPRHAPWCQHAGPMQWPRESGWATVDCDELAEASHQAPSVSALRDLSSCFISTHSRLARRGCRIGGWAR